MTWKTIIERLRLRLNAIEYSGKLWTYKVPIFDLLFAMCADMLTSPRAGVNTDSEEGRDIQPPHAGALLHPRHHRRYRACAPSFSTHISFSPNYFTPFLIGAGGKKTDKESPQLGPADELRLMTSEQLSEKKKRRISIDTLKSKLLLGTSIFYTRLSRKKKQANSPMVLLFQATSYRTATRRTRRRRRRRRRARRRSTRRGHSPRAPRTPARSMYTSRSLSIFPSLIRLVRLVVSLPDSASDRERHGRVRVDGANRKQRADHHLHECARHSCNSHLLSYRRRRCVCVFVPLARARADSRSPKLDLASIPSLASNSAPPHTAPPTPSSASMSSSSSSPLPLIRVTSPTQDPLPHPAAEVRPSHIVVLERSTR